MPEEREGLKMWVRECRKEPEGERSICEGTGSRAQVVRWTLASNLATSSIVVGLKEGSNDCTSGHEVYNMEGI